MSSREPTNPTTRSLGDDRIAQMDAEIAKFMEQMEQLKAAREIRVKEMAEQKAREAEAKRRAEYWRLSAVVNRLAKEEAAHRQRLKELRQRMAEDDKHRQKSRQQHKVNTHAQQAQRPRPRAKGKPVARDDSLMMDLIGVQTAVEAPEDETLANGTKELRGLVELNEQEAARANGKRPVCAAVLEAGPLKRAKSKTPNNPPCDWCTRSSVTCYPSPGPRSKVCSECQRLRQVCEIGGQSVTGRKSNKGGKSKDIIEASDEESETGSTGRGLDHDAQNSTSSCEPRAGAETNLLHQRLENQQCRIENQLQAFEALSTQVPKGNKSFTNNYRYPRKSDRGGPADVERSSCFQYI